ncbi:MAG: cytochrome b/b6 domain-containing protein [Verrucomicrobiia bacterium]
MRPLGFLPLGILLVTLTFPAFAGLKNSDCLDCHSDNTLAITNAAGRTISLFVDEARLKASAHKTNSCISCHADVTVKHPDDNVPPKTVNCATCHEQQTENYDASVHGLAARAGHLDAATCQDCHDSHEIVPANLPASPLHFSHVAQTCGACHDQEVRDWAISVHGQAMAAGIRDAPTCTDCHSEHKIQALKNTSPQVSAEVCSRCHASERLNTKYNLPGDRVKTFFESYHGLAVQYGSTVAANCGSCHGYHKILPSTDPRSTINKAHLVETCGKCHPGADEKFASGKIHLDLAAGNGGTDFSAKINRWVRRIYLVLIIGTIGAMFIHNALFFLRKVAARYRAAVRPVVRMSLAQRWQHFVLAASFIILAITGFALKFPDSFLARALGSSEPFRRWTHRVAGIVLLLVGLWHLIYLLGSREGRRLVCDLFPVKKDVTDVWTQIRYLLGWSKEKPKMGRFGYAEKMEYWAVIWGTIIMGVSGLMIWFKMDVTRFLPRWAVDVALTIHYYEAVLACLAIVVWHFYHVIFDPDVYPLNPACFDGHVSEEWQKHEHPLDKPRK